MKSINLEIITPERVVFKDEVKYISAPSETGQIGILPDHVPLFTILEEGEIKIERNGEEIFIAIGGGFLEVARNYASILVTSAYHAEEINEAEVLEAKKRAESALSEKPAGEALTAAQLQFRRSQIALKVLRRKRRPLTESS
ncbi:ATP synthase F1 subunit epsilon [Candidatus Gottesmanbacteria bacterium RIFCSPHIGHO2_02_FULL_40_24]|uniref:ATP synthase epsilon chain n=1 Tax=Candidatus Gottesmanbacteria bacterium RIFCSPHIGHO2_01_FULL_40_15 TaxID=1798376 RepID=A0A1F5Z7P9_9BACT|nr:MAG: ATP synthase F1 subunit epsilon [Candidatus Gottesmanbacteria bacterium RIFCSPHIGHO2_01_FULL_40_15]OGG16812.1 MAG: ATP synthase F1 subunit epsilon [Candidatus Gottesmanbacteria bacterium RIFCSPHIGHO2_02_FULL_40_24]OGG23134.1 MAG: ATP synthase F1 subunit epsilon [Candidatus Gottesmanbacteria bacterium RIFCSPHIGHO2_12_FULL_40_13]OGG31828.1 MAG: ATP synthase F1 subunit epsilon [Candidatus Gottesmanbacteria bacterium RIFCSPLOWO2_02_FULL_40_10]